MLQKKIFIIIVVFTLLCVKAMSQQFEWMKSFQTSQDGEIRCVIVTNDNNYVASGLLNYNGYVMKTDTSGAVLWSKSFSYLDEIYQIQQTNDGGYAFYASEINPVNYLFVKTNSTCDTLWTKQFLHGFSRNNKCFQQTTDNGYILAYTGNSDSIYLTKCKAICILFPPF